MPCYATPGASIFSSLRRGDIITVSTGFGYPKAEKSTEEVVLQRNGFSALLVSGRRVIGRDAPGIKKTGKRKPISKDMISSEAAKLYKEANGGKEPL